MLESDYQAYLIVTIEDRVLPGSIVLKNDSGFRPGIPDLSVFCPGGWGFLEVKKSADAPEQPNQRWYVERADKMYFGAFIYPENEERVLDALQRALQPSRSARFPKRQ